MIAPLGRTLTSEVVVGRAEPLALLDGVLTAAIAGTASVTLLSGEAGVGKTRLALEAEARARTLGLDVLHGESVEFGGDAIAYAPVVAALRGLGEPMSRQVLVSDGIYSAAHDPTFTWRDLEWLQSIVRIPLLVKGIMTPEAAEEAIQAGVAGLIVSNHGGRSLDTVPATAEVLSVIADQVAGRVPLLVDGGIRRGTDVLKALGMGAQAVLMGRPYLYALAVAGAAGISRAVDILATELKMAMAMSGRPTVAGIGRDVIWMGPSRP